MPHTRKPMSHLYCRHGNSLHRLFLAEAQESVIIIIIIINIILGVYDVINLAAQKKMLKRKREARRRITLKNTEVVPVQKETYGTSQRTKEEKFIRFTSFRSCQITSPQIRDTLKLVGVLLVDTSHHACLCEDTFSISKKIT